MMKALRFLTVSVVGIGVLCGSALSAAPAANIKVGAAMNLTGPASTWGQYHAKGHQDYFRYVNEIKGGVAGRQLELILVDTAY
ncbi:MAG: ABC transporter substrate-binding protein, partial [Desulfomonilia bacterium]